MENTQDTAMLLEKAKQQMAEDMKARGIGAIIWSIPAAGFHYIPEILVKDPKTGKERTVRVTGLYRFGEELYAIEEDEARVSVDQYYERGIEVPPVVVTLTESKADEQLGKPTPEKGYTPEGSLEEWLAIADCYFEALKEE